jgi:molybdopterin converting factor subunit 1
MRCDVLLFAELAETLGTDRLALDLAEGATAADALARLCRDHPPIAAQRDMLALAVNSRYCAPATVLRDGDALALIPPVSGG